MTPRPRIEPFFLESEQGRRFCLLHTPPPGIPQRSGVLYVHPFAEEMNKTRRMAAMQSRALAALGHVVLQIDLFACGDSCGEMRDASIALWHSDIQAAAEWMQARGLAPLTVWGLRFGCLLGLAWASATTMPIDRLLLWQPVVNGEAHLNQFLRIGTASAMLSAGTASAGPPLRSRLAQGAAVEVAGYDISPQLASGMDSLRIADASCPAARIDWFEVVANAEGGMAPISQRTIGAWQARGLDVHQHVIGGESFWATVETTDCPELLAATTRLMEQRWTADTPSAR